MALGDVVRHLERAADTAAIGARRLLGLDTNPVPASWTHVTKVDPETSKQLPLAYPLYLSHTGAVAVGGSEDVTGENTEETFDLLSALPVPAFHEPSGPTHVTEATRNQAAFLAVPEVLNGGSEALVGTLGEALAHVRETMGPDILEERTGYRFDGPLGDRLFDCATAYLHREAVFEAYIIMNPDSAAARRANVTTEDLLSPRQAHNRALAAEYHLESEVIYLEYSGTYGGREAIDILEAVDDAVTWPRIWYGGGLDSRERVETIREAGADAVIVGDVFHEIAQLESDLYRDARSAFDGEGATKTAPDTEELSAWVEESVDVATTSPARYLSTIPGVDDPEARARRYLAVALAVRLEIDAIAAELDGARSDSAETEPATVESVFASGTVPGEEVFEPVLGEDARPFARRLARGLLASDVDGVESDDGLPATHLATGT